MESRKAMWVFRRGHSSLEAGKMTLSNYTIYSQFCTVHLHLITSKEKLGIAVLWDQTQTNYNGQKLERSKKKGASVREERERETLIK